MIIRYENKILVIFYQKYFSEIINKREIDSETLVIIIKKNCLS